ncbi:MAG: tail fiber domain-containing protein [Dehalococcoidia bacterium]
MGHDHDDTYWCLTGNAGTTPGTNFLGTTDDTDLQLRVNNQRALLIESASVVNVIGGDDGNSVAPGVIGATISGGGSFNHENQITDPIADHATIGGGEQNIVSGHHATVSGGFDNQATTTFTTVGGGVGNRATVLDATVSGGSGNIASGGKGATVSGGITNTASNQTATVGGGELNVASGQNATIGGGFGNTAGGTATVAGGRQNNAGGQDSFIGGGNANTTTRVEATIGGGFMNLASGEESFIGGGKLNTASALQGTVGGGEGNLAGGIRGSTVGGGFGNTADGASATTPGGFDNTASADYSFAAGRHAKIIDLSHDGATVFAGSNNFDFSSMAANEFAVRATGGTRIVSAIDGSGNITAGVQLNPGAGAWSALSDRATKTNFSSVDGREILERLNKIPIEFWSYKSQDDSIRHIGPMAQDFYAAFGTGEDEKHISTIDADGIALAAIQGLSQMVQEKDAQIAELEARLVEVEQALGLAEATANPRSSRFSGSSKIWMIGLALGLVLGSPGLILGYRRFWKI